MVEDAGRARLGAQAQVNVHVVIHAGAGKLAAGAAFVDAYPGLRLERSGPPSIGDELDPARHAVVDDRAMSQVNAAYPEEGAVYLVRIGSNSTR